MSSGLPISERLNIIQEIFLVIGDNKLITEATGPQCHSFWLIRAILNDQTYTCINRQRLIAVLRKSPVWARVRPFLVNGDTTCDRAGCKCSRSDHKSFGGACEGSKYKPSRIGNRRWVSVKCTCPGYVKRDF